MQASWVPASRDSGLKPRMAGSPWLPLDRGWGRSTEVGEVAAMVVQVGDDGDSGSDSGRRGRILNIL